MVSLIEYPIIVNIATINIVEISKWKIVNKAKIINTSWNKDTTPPTA